MECPYCGRKMTEKGQTGTVLDRVIGPSCVGGFLHRHEFILWGGDKFLTRSMELARELADRGYHIRKVGNDYEIIPLLIIKGEV